MAGLLPCAGSGGAVGNDPLACRGVRGAAGDLRVRVSPDGRRLLMLRPVDGEHQLFLADLRTGATVPVLVRQDGKLLRECEWASDERIVFSWMVFYRKPPHRRHRPRGKLHGHVAFAELGFFCAQRVAAGTTTAAIAQDALDGIEAFGVASGCWGSRSRITMPTSSPFIPDALPAHQSTDLARPHQARLPRPRQTPACAHRPLYGVIWKAAPRLRLPGNNAHSLGAAVSGEGTNRPSAYIRSTVSMPSSPSPLERVSAVRWHSSSRSSRASLPSTGQLS